MSVFFTDADKMREECGVFGVFGHKDAATLTALGLHALQHRGQEAAGIASFDGQHFHLERKLGLVGDNFTKHRLIDRLPGDHSIGHVRYSTTGETTARNTQPFFADLAIGGLTLAHNGNLTNARSLRRDLVAQGAIFQSTSDTETIIHLVSNCYAQTLQDRLIAALKQVEGAYSLIALNHQMMIGMCDPRGVRPLVLGRLGDSFILSSESCALDIIHAEFIRDIEPGELVTIEKKGVTSHFPFPKIAPRFCLFEYIYFARPDSIVKNVSVYEARKKIGAELARENPVPADIVVPIPDSGNVAALGFARQSGIAYESCIIRNHYVGRTFIEPSEAIRHFGVRLKHNVDRAAIYGKKVVLIDDSIVRGTTSKKILAMVRAAGAKEIHLRIASPPTTHSCFYGVDTPKVEALLAHHNTVEQMRIFLGADSLGFISIDGLYRAMGIKQGRKNGAKFCDACMTGDYPIPLHDQNGVQQEEQLSLLSEFPES